MISQWFLIGFHFISLRLRITNRTILSMFADWENKYRKSSLPPGLYSRHLVPFYVQQVTTKPRLYLSMMVAFGQAILQCLGSLLPFLEYDLIDNLPFLAASSIAVLPSSLHQDIINSLCFYILPFTIPRHKDRERDICQSVSAVIMMIFQYSTNPAHHCQLFECLMTLKHNVLQDVLCVISHGTSAARASAAKLLFYYWPTFNANLFDRKNLICKFAEPTPFVCQRDMCPNAGNAEAAKVCYDHCISITFASDTPPPLYLCIECANDIHREHPNQQFFDILHPMQQVSMNCRSSDKSAISICFSTECASYNGNHPIRYCDQCHNNRHNNRRGMDHIVHKSLPPTWTMEPEMQTYMVEAIVSLLNEAKVPQLESKDEKKESESKESKEGKDGKERKSPIPAVDNITIEERQLLGRYGVWLLVGRCTPTENTPVEVLGRLLAMIFHWFHMTAYSYDGQEESTLEKLKTEVVCSWLRDISESHYELFISCLLPHPPEDTLSSRTTHLKDGLNRLFCLVPYEVITQEIWDYVMPHWMEAIVNDVPEKELFELRIILSKILDSELGPLGFNSKKMYQFVAFRFKKTNAKVQEQALHWLQTLTLLEIVTPLHLLFSIFEEGVSYMKNGSAECGGETIKCTDLEIPGAEQKRALHIEDSGSTKASFSDEENRLSQLAAEQEDGDERNLSCCILMLDILLKQMELQDIDKHTGLNSSLCKNVCWLLKSMITTAWIGNHSCLLKSECTYCESSVMWHQLSLQLIKYLLPIYPAHPADPPLDENWDDVYSRKSPPESDKKEAKADVVLNMPIPEVHSVGGVLVHMPHIMTATVETVSEQLDLAAIMPAEKVVSAVARSITLSESDVATATVHIAKPQVIGKNDEPVETDSGEDVDNFWQTSVGKFKFSVDELPQPFQYIHQLLQELSKVDKPDILYYMLQCLNVLILHGDACTKASKEHRGFFIWCQENLIIKEVNNTLWNLCNSEHSHICQAVVPLLLHCITLPAGSDVFWRVIQESFHHPEWGVRFKAVERVTVITRFMDSSPLRNLQQLQAALANAFCYLISSMDDNNVYVAQRATLYLGTIHDSAIKSLIMCLETQFDCVIVDRPMVLQCLYQLHNSLKSQISLEKSGDISYLRDLRNSDMNSEGFIRKVHRAHEALSQSEGTAVSSVKTLSASFGAKWPYKRTMSAPASIVTRHESKETKEKVYSRQYSAPILKRKSSRFGLGQFLGTSNSIPDGHMHSLNVVEDQNLTTFLQRVIDIEEADKETMHLLVFLLMQFLSRSDQAFPAEEKNLAKTQGIVLRHLYLLLGYSQNDRGLYLPPQRLRSSPAFSVFLSNLPQIMDQNHLMGRLLLPTCLILLQYAPSPYYIPNTMEFQQPSFSLWSLEPHFRKNWLMSLVVLLYKYQYNQQPYCMQLSSLIKIVLNTLDSQHHHCRRIPATIMVGALPSRSRDVSQPSLGADIDHPERTTPPLSPMYSYDGQSVQVSVSSKGGKIQVAYAKPSSTKSMETHWEEAIQCVHPEKKLKRLTDISIDDDTESELIAIPESDMSDSTLQGSVQDSFEDGASDTCYSSAEKQLTIVRSPKDAYINQLVKLNSNKTKSTWIIGSEDESLKSCDNRIQESLRTHSNCSKLNTTVSINGTQLTRTITTDFHKHLICTIVENPHHWGNIKKIVEPSITPVCTPVSDCDDCYKNNQAILPTPSLERLLPIGSVMLTDSPLRDDVFSPALESQLEIPIQERLLPIGQHTKDISQLVDKVRLALGINAQLAKAENKKSETFVVQQEQPQPTSSQYHSPRKLIKQVALESPPHQFDAEDNGYFFRPLKADNQKDLLINHRQRMRKIGPFAINSYAAQDPRKPGTWDNPELSPKYYDSDLKQSSFRTGDDCVNERCSECGTVKEEYSDEEIGLCIVTLGTFIHREPALAAPMLPDILSIVAKVATNAMYPWQSESNIHLPGGAISVAHQFIRCVLHQLAPNGIFTQMFQTNAPENIRIQFFKSVIQALIDFNELNPIAPLQLLLEALNSKKTLPVDTLPIILQNMAYYLNCLPLEAPFSSSTSLWGTVLQQLEILYRKIIFLLNTMDDITSLLKIIISVFKIPLISQFKGLLEPFSKVMSYAIQTQVLKYSYLTDICYLCSRAFTKERDKLIISRMVVFELVQALKFKTNIPDSNLIMLINLILQDIGGAIPSNVVIKDCPILSVEYGPTFTTGISECMKLNLGDILEFLTDFHAISKMKSYCKGNSVGLNDDTLGGIIKCNVAQYLALEITKGNGRDNRAVTRYFPWLYTTSTTQQSPREFIECIGHIRLLSWLLLGSLTHTALQGNNNGQMLSQPIPQEASCQIADHIQVIMAGFAEQPKASILHMSSLFHTFILCQLWTVYLEQGLGNHVPVTEALTPCVLQLVQQSKMLSEIVSLHFLSMLEALVECQSTFVGKLLPLWTPVLCSNQIQLPGHLQMRLQNCRNFPPTSFQDAIPEKNKLINMHNPMLLKWLQRLQFKMGQIELQSSTATQFYSFLLHVGASIFLERYGLCAGTILESLRPVLSYILRHLVKVSPSPLLKASRNFLLSIEISLYSTFPPQSLNGALDLIWRTNSKAVTRGTLRCRDFGIAPNR
ncbi:hypothetical protein NQ317_007018 [Molorchus minor]|uniref:Protein unc-79 homolog n=1 Tax=Molorchus minor TaxID=1323400 RepID=A0ABQ9JU96_9CUCU|nr:hypothetical protein NQ317_007018 [Molorchus minor]